MAATEPANHVSSLFSSLLEQSRKLRQETDNDGLETVQLGLNELERRAKDLKKTREGAQTDARAHYLLAAGGINTDEALRDLDSIDFQNAYEPSTIRVDTDIDTYLRNRKEQNVMSSIEDGMRRTSRDFDSFVAKNVTIEWEAQKQRIFEHFGLTPRNTTAPSAAADPRHNTFNGGLSAFGASSFGRSKLGQSFGPGVAGRGSVWAKSTMGTSVLGRPTAANTPGASTGKLFTDVDPTRQNDMSRQVQLRQQQFSVAVKQLNEVRIENGADGGIYPVMKNFGDITGASGNDMLTLQLHDSWKLLGFITNESEIRDGNPFGGPHERQFKKDYILNTSPDSAEASRIRKLVQKGARRFLEKQFLEMVERAISENPQVAKVGGIPSIFHKFRGYINVRLSANKDLPEWDLKNFDYVSDVPCWAIIFYLLRAGFLEEADEFVKQNQQSFQKLDRSFPTYLHAYCSAGDERRLPRNLLDRIQGEYNNRVRHSEDTKDIFKPAVYKIIGRCDLSKRSVPNVMPTAEDWMWLQLVLAREIDKTTEPAHEVFTLTDLQKGVLQFGAKHFSQKGSNVGLYFQMLMMSGLFEDAVHYLYSFQYVDGVHFAIALTYYGLLRPTSNPASVGGELLTLGQNGEKQINFPRLIGYYTNDFRTPNTEEAVDYISLLCLNADLPAPTGPNHLTVCHESLRELVLDTKEFTKLLGDVRADGTREKGAIEKRMRLIKLSDQREYLRTITEQAAAQADDDGRANDAILLYHLAEDYDTAMQIVNKNLSDFIASEEPQTYYHDSKAAAGLLSSSISLTSVEDPVQLAQNMLDMYSPNASVYSKVELRNRETVGVLLNIANAKKHYENGDWESCLLKIASIDVIPLDPYVDIGSIRRRANNFATLHETVSRNVGILLKMAVESCHRLSTDIRGSSFADASRDQRLVELKARTRCAMIYAGLIQYKLPANVYEFINSRDVTDGF